MAAIPNSPLKLVMHPGGEPPGGAIAIVTPVPIPDGGFCDCSSETGLDKTPLKAPAISQVLLIFNALVLKRHRNECGIANVRLGT